MVNKVEKYMESFPTHITLAEPKRKLQEQEQVQVLDKPLTIHIPMYHVILLDDDYHTYDYVIEMLMKIFGHSREAAFEMATKVDSDGFVIVDTTHKDRAELKRDQVHSYGKDWRMRSSVGSMSAIVEPADCFD